jgi:uncharacterized cupin superfamily protein
VTLAHWDDAPSERVTVGPMDAVWTDLGEAAGSVTVGARRIRLDPGGMPTPPHAHGAEEEIFYVLAGAGLSWQDGATHEIAVGDCLVHRANGAAHTLRAGPDGLDVLAFGMRVPVEAGPLPRSGVAWLGPTWVEVGGDPPWDREAALGPVDFPAPSPRPPSTVNLSQVTVRRDRRTTVGRALRDLGRAAGSVSTGLRHAEVLPGMLHAPPHCHSAEEELVVVLEGTGELLLGDETLALRAGHVVARPAGTGIAHAFRGGPGGMAVLLYGTRDPRDLVFYPRSRKLILRGLGVAVRLEPVDYWEGEE